MSQLLTSPHLRHRPAAEGMVARQRWQWAVVGVVLIGATMSALELNIVKNALPTLTALLLWFRGHDPPTHGEPAELM